MAGRKLTVLPALGEFPAADDLMYVVDISDTSESPQGTSKAVEFSDIMQAGTYTPTFSGENNCTAIAEGSQPWHYIKVGNEVSVIGVSLITLDALESGCEFLFSLPFLPNNDWSASFQISSNISVSSVSIGDLPNLINFSLTADRDTPSKNARISIQLDAASAGSDVTCAFTLQYSINN